MVRPAPDPTLGDLYDKVSEQSEVIRNAREKLRMLLDDEPESAEGEA